MKARKILIVDNDRNNRASLIEAFKDTHYEVHCTTSAAYAIAKIIQGNSPIVMLSDTFEENISVNDVVAIMKKCNRNLKIILIADDTSLETLKKLREEGIFYHSLKPHTQSDFNELNLAIQSIRS